LDSPVKRRIVIIEYLESRNLLMYCMILFSLKFEYIFNNMYIVYHIFE
jgi:hypothetical protein